MPQMRRQEISRPQASLPGMLGYATGENMKEEHLHAFPLLNKASHCELEGCTAVHFEDQVYLPEDEMRFLLKMKWSMEEAIKRMTNLPRSTVRRVAAEILKDLKRKCAILQPTACEEGNHEPR